MGGVTRTARRSAAGSRARRKRRHAASDPDAQIPASSRRARVRPRLVLGFAARPGPAWREKTCRNVGVARSVTTATVSSGPPLASPRTAHHHASRCPTQAMHVLFWERPYDTPLASTARACHCCYNTYSIIPFQRPFSRNRTSSLVCLLQSEARNGLCAAISVARSKARMHSTRRNPEPPYIREEAR